MGANNYLVTVAFLTYMFGVFALGLLAHKLLSRGEFMGQYFLGGKNLGVWTLALTFASTSASGGSFTGFPALVFHNGWIVALWIASYMMVPVVTMGVMGRRLNQLGHMTKALTVPDVLRDRFQKPALGIACTVLIMCFLMFNLVGQFSAGGRIMARVMGWPTVVLHQDVDKQIDGGRHLRLTQSRTGTDITMQLTTRDGQVRPFEAKTEGELRAASPEAFRLYRDHGRSTGWGYTTAVIAFAVVVVLYTAYGGFWAVVWTDVMQGIWMGLGIVIMLPIALIVAGGLGAATERLAARDPGFVTAPGPADFHPPGLMISYFVMWAIVGMGQPASMWRLMAFKNTRVLSRSIFTVMIYYSLIYFPIVIIFVCARSLDPPLAVLANDDAMPVTAVEMARRGIGDVLGPLLGGAIIAAPFAAIMSTVDSFLLMISSGLVRDLYQRTFAPDVSEKTIKRLTYLVTALVGTGVTLVALRPPEFLQYIIVFTGQGLACCLLAPMVLALFWRRASGTGALSAVLAGFVTFISLYVGRWVGLLPKQGFGPASELAPYWLLGLEPVVWGLAASFVTGIVVSLCTKAPESAWVDRLFTAPKTTG